MARLIRRVRDPLWIAAIVACMLIVSSAMVIVRAIPASYASIPEESISEDAQAQLARARVTDDRRNRPWCPECGIVESMRQVERSGHIGAAIATTGKSYELTVRFRDGSKTVFNEATPRIWRQGSRVIVIAGTTTSNN